VARKGKKSRRIWLLKYEKKGALAVYHSILVGRCPTKMALEVGKKGALTVYHSILVGRCPTKTALEVRKNVWRKENRAVARGKKGKGELEDILLLLRAPLIFGWGL
jgi:hypothetical protein